MPHLPGAELLWRGLGDLGVTRVFGLPGTQNVPAFDALRRSGIRATVPVHELGAAFAAVGWARATCTPGVVLTIPGPGFAWTLPALAEASHDSTPVLLVVAGVLPLEGSPLRLQLLDHASMAGPVLRAAFRVARADQLLPALQAAWDATTAGEPGPVLLELEAAALEGMAPMTGLVAGAPAAPEAGVVGEVARRIAASTRPVILAGQGASAAAAEVQALAERLGAPVVTTLSGRGLLPEDHPLAVGLDLGGPGLASVNTLMDGADLILVLGAKLSHNGTGGFRLRLPADRVVRVDSSAEQLGVGPQASLPVRADVPALLGALARRDDLPDRREAWTAVNRPGPDERDEPGIAGASIGTAGELFGRLRALLPRDARLVTDSGRHQVLARRHFPVLAAGGLIAPSDFQSMGFAIPAAIGAALATPDRRVVAVVGDGGLMMSGLELLTAASERLPLVVMVLADGAYGLIRDQQVRDHGTPFGTELPPFGLEALAEACGAGHVLLEGDADAALGRALATAGPVLLEVRLGETLPRRRAAAAATARATVRRAMPAGLLARLRQLLGRG